MRLKIKLIDPDLPLPEYQTSGAAAFDLITRLDTTIQPQGVARIPCNVVIEIPKGYMLFLKDRSSTAMRRGLLATAGIIDSDFCGEEDEILFQVYNFTDQPVTVERGERVGQGILVKIAQADWQVVDSMAHNKTRGGFGTSGSKINVRRKTRS